MKIRDRVKELRRVKASELIPHPDNWRTHPPHQRAALQGVLDEVGYADALIAYETPAGLQLIDGHLRAETTPDQKVPVLVVDLDEAEAKKVLATLDPLTGLAEANTEALDALVDEIETQNEAIKSLLNGHSSFPCDIEKLQQDFIENSKASKTKTIQAKIVCLADHEASVLDSIRATVAGFSEAKFYVQ